MTFKMRICIFVLLSNVGLYLTYGQTTEYPEGTTLIVNTRMTTPPPISTVVSYTTDAETTIDLTTVQTTTEDLTTMAILTTTELTTPETTESTPTDEPPKANDCRKSKSFVCQYDIKQQHDDNCKTVVETAYKRSFLNPDMIDANCGDCSNPIKCEITTKKAYCENAMLIAFVNGITLMDDINATIIFETIRVEDTDKRIDLKVLGLIILAVFAVFLLFTIFIIIVKKRNHRRKNGGCKAKPMKKMTMRQTIKTWFYIKETKMDRNELTTVEDKSFDNNGAVQEDVECKVTSVEGVINEEKQVDEREAAPLPIERPKETLPRPNPHNSYLGLDEIKDPIYVNQKVLQT
ncbi:uncharacterized protein [Antedon mediterranea]|uniref:uncharacterized protein isoform X2 n=1 Tax=Antedon mediterranea TaxID=105859 RepID=UPI003AF67A16